MTPETFKRMLSKARSIDTYIPETIAADLSVKAASEGLARSVFLKRLMTEAVGTWSRWYVNKSKKDQSELTNEKAQRMLDFTLMPTSKKDIVHISFLVDTKTRKTISAIANAHRLTTSQAVRLLIAIGLEFKVVNNGR